MTDEASMAGTTGPRFVFRNPRPDQDAARVARLYSEAEAVDQIGAGVDGEEQIREQWVAPEVDLSRDRWVVEEPGSSDRLIAMGGIYKAATQEDAFIFALVHPATRRQGIGGELLARSLARAHELGVVAVKCWFDLRLTAGVEFLEHHGFRRSAVELEMRAPADVELPEPVYPAGYTVVSYDRLQRLDLLLEAYNRGFIGNYGHRDATPEEIQQWLSAPATRHDGVLVAFAPDGGVAGICGPNIDPGLAERRGVPTGYIDNVGVVPEHRRKGLGRALLLSAMRWLRANGMGPIELNVWAANERAVPLYEELGFVAFGQIAEYRREL